MKQPESAAAAYRGRFAPSPTGPLHFGSLVAALGSYLEARARGGEWLVRMEDLDPPREEPGAADAILRSLERLGFEWDGEVIYQSGRQEAYLDALGKLQRRGASYPCICSRKQVAAAGLSGVEGPRYPGTCRNGTEDARETAAMRVITDHASIAFADRVRGPVSQDLASELGDFIVRRADGQIAYQLAVVVDDAYQGITDVVRGADLLLSTPRQIHLQQLLGLPTPGYAHLPLVLNAQGEKLSKQQGAQPLDAGSPLQQLLDALEFLQQKPPPEPPLDLVEFWSWAVANWDLGQLGGCC